MKSRKVLRKKRIFSKKITSLIIYGIIFLISTITFYVVNTSIAQKVLQVEVCVLDEELQVDEVSYELKVPEEDGLYITSLPQHSGGFFVDGYTFISEEEYLKIKEENQIDDKEDNIKEENKKATNDKTTSEKKTDDKTVSDKATNEEKKAENKVDDKTTTDNKVEEKIEENKATANEKKTDDKTSNGEKTNNESKDKTNSTETSTKENVAKEENTKSNVQNKEKSEDKTKRKIELEGEGYKKVLPEDEFELTVPEDSKDEIQKLYLVAKYQKKENKGNTLYNKIITETTQKNNVIVTGYMPKDSELKVKEVDVKSVEEKIKKNTDNEVKLEIAYDIKILNNEKEYEPNQFDETADVKISGLENKSINIWHIIDDKNVEKMTIYKSTEEDDSIDYRTLCFSVYGIEVLEDETENIDTLEQNDASEQGTNSNEIKDENNEESNGDNKEDSGSSSPAKAPGDPLRAAPSATEADVTMTIDDYNSDVYHYKGKNYTDSIAGTNAGTYTSFAKVTIVYHSFVSGETNALNKGRVSLTEREDIINHIRGVPINSASVELMANPFMDMPENKAFGGWTTNTANCSISTDSKTLTQTLNISSLSANAQITVNIYTNWIAANVVYVDYTTGNDNLNNGLTPTTPVGSWGAACSKLASNATSRTDRERNIIVVVGPMDSSINYTKTVTGTQQHVVQITYTSNTTPTSGQTYIISRGQGANNNSLASNGNTNIGNQNTSATVEPSTAMQWVITGSGTSFTIQNVATGRYLAYNNGLTQTTSSFTWTIENRYIYYVVSGNTRRYLRYSNNSWTTSTSNTASNRQFYFLQYTKNEYDTVTTTRANSFSNNSNYSNLALTVTSMYNHEDYRSTATITLPNSNNGDFEINTDFQMHHVSVAATGYTAHSSTSTFSTTYPWLTGYNHNVRLGRGIQAATTGTNGTVFSDVIGGHQSETSGYDNRYKLIVESGKYSSIQGYNYYVQNGSNYNYQGTIYLTLGSDYDRGKNANGNLSVYNVATITSSNGKVGQNTVTNPAFWIVVKSGQIGVDFFNSVTTENRTYCGIYVGGYGVTASGTTQDSSDRCCLIEGGVVANLIGGLRAHENTGVTTRIYMKGGEVFNIVGGAGRSTTYEDRMIQITGGTVDYSVCGGSNGYYANNDANQDAKIIHCNTLVYIGGNAQIGANASSTLYDISSGCVLGAGNGKESVSNSGQVSNTHVIVNDEAHILRHVYGGGNFGIVGPPNATTAISKVEILGGTIDGNVFGGCNKNNIYGSTTINVKGGLVKGAVYGGSNTSGTISTNTTINVTGGTLGESTNDITDPILFGGGYGSTTVVSGNATVNILDTDDDVTMKGSAYGGSSLGTITGNTTVNIRDTSSANNDISITGNVFGGGKGETNTAATVNGNSTVNVDGSNIPNASVFGGNDVNGVTNGEIKVHIGQNNTSVVGNVYGGGREDDTGTEADCVYVYLHSHADVTNAFNGGKAADLTSTSTSDTTRAIYLQGGDVDNLFGGSDTSGNVTASHVYIQSGTAANVYGGNNVGGQTAVSYVSVTGGTSTNVYGGGYQATTPTTNVTLSTGGTVVNGFGGGNSANVTTANITLAGASATKIFGGSDSSGTVNTANVTITSGTVTDVYGGNNQGGNTVDTIVLINSAATNVYGGGYGRGATTTGDTLVTVNSTVANVFGGGNDASTSGDTLLILHNATVTGSAYGGGNGEHAVVVGDSTTKVDGTTTIANDLFGGGNAAPNGTAQSNSTVTVLLTGGTISGDLYGAANTSVVNGETIVKIGAQAVNDNNLLKDNISISGTVFGGGKSNTAGSASYDFDFESVTGDAHVTIDAYGYNTTGTGAKILTIGQSVFGSGNAAKISGDGIVEILNYGTSSAMKTNVSIQRAAQVTLDNCWIHLTGTTDTTNEIATALYTFNRIDDLILKNNTTLYLDYGVNITSKLRSLDSSGQKEEVDIDSTGITRRTVDNRIYLAQGKNIILRTEARDHGEVYGMAYVGMYVSPSDMTTGIYNSTYTHGANIPAEIRTLFDRNSYVQGKHYLSHDIEVDGFYTNFNDNNKIKVDFITPRPRSADYYQWIVGDASADIYYDDIELIATKYATTAAYVLYLDGLSNENTEIEVVDVDISQLDNSILLDDPNNIPNIAANATDADTKFGLTMTAGNTGWQTRGTTNILTANNGDFSGTDYYLSDNSTTTPTFSLYMAHSKNISNTAVLGTVTIHLTANYIEDGNAIERQAYIVIKLSTNNTIQLDKDYYEGAITIGKEYSMFPTTTTTITKNSSFSTYYSLFINNYTNTDYYTGFVGHYYHVLVSSCVFPAGTKITFMDTSTSTTRYYYYIVSAADATANKKVFRFTDFKAMDSTNEPYSADGSYYDSTTDYLVEEFIFQVDFEDTTITSNYVSQNLLVQLRDAYDNNIAINVNTSQYPMLFSVYYTIEATKNVTLAVDKNVMYMGDLLTMDIENTYRFNKNENQNTVYDTTLNDDKLGVKITISSGSGNLTFDQLAGVYIRYNLDNVFAGSDGSFRMKLADTVANVQAQMFLHTENGRLTTGTYTITVQSFGSSDGVYFTQAIDSDSKNVQIISSNFGLKVTLGANSQLIDAATGKDKNNSNQLTYTIEYSGAFNNAKITVTLCRRDYDPTDEYTYTYDPVDLATYVTDNLTSTANQNEYLVANSPQSSQNFVMNMRNNLKTGTYKVVFSLYDGVNLLGTIDKTIIIK